MSTRKSTSAYQAATASGASQAGLLQLVYGSIARDLMRAAQAVRNTNIEARCAASKHALSLLGHVDSWLADFDDRNVAASLRSFYGMLRSAILQLQAAPDAETFERLAQLVLDTRAAWQAREESSLMSPRADIRISDQTPGPFSFHA